MECDNAIVDLTCVQENTDYPGYDLRGLVVDSIETCVTLCKDTQDCMSVTYKDLTNKCYLKRKDFEWWEEKSMANARSTNLKCIETE